MLVILERIADSLSNVDFLVARSEREKEKEDMREERTHSAERQDDKRRPTTTARGEISLEQWREDQKKGGD